MKFEETPEYRFGDEAQREWMKILSSRGRSVLPVYDMTCQEGSEKAPRLFCVAGEIVAPDMLVLSPGKKLWCDVKAKSVPTWRRCRPGPRWEHGCDWYHANDYRIVQEKTGIEAWICVREIMRPIDARFGPSNGESPFDYLEDERSWRLVSVDVAFGRGEHRTDWPGGAAQPLRRGARGQGGLLWDRELMRRFKCEE